MNFSRKGFDIIVASNRLVLSPGGSLCLLPMLLAVASALQTNQECVHYAAGEELAVIDFVLVLGYQASDC